MPEIVKGKKEQPELPIQDHADGNGRAKDHNLGYTPTRIGSILSFDLSVNGLGIFSQVTKEDVAVRSGNGFFRRYSPFEPFFYEAVAPERD